MKMETQKDATITPVHNGGALDRAVDRASVGAHQTIDSISSSGKPAVDRLAARAHEAVDRVSSVAGRAVESLGTGGDQLSAAEQKLVAGTRKYVQENPVTSVGIAIATGYFLSRLFSSR
jgi:ElaB/YqjD/DUF883 family membrane-anchored ribosome-binding protein